MRYSFCNVAVDSINENMLEEKFNSCGYDAEEIFISKEIFEQCPDDEDENFRYRFAIVKRDYSEFGEDCNNFGVYMYLIPLSNKIAMKLNDAYCDDEKRLDVESDLYIELAANEGYGVLMGMDETISFDTDDDESYSLAEKIAHEKVVIGANVFETINSLRGFYLDKYQNRIGTTGWDMIEDWVFNRCDCYRIPIERWAAEHGK